MTLQSGDAARPLLLPSLGRVPSLLTHVAYPTSEHSVPPGVHRSGQYEARFARDLDDLRRVQRFRCDVLNAEPASRDGMFAPYESGPEDDFDVRSHHLMVLDTDYDEIVGTYALTTSELTPERDALSSATEFDLSELPERVFRHGAEVGRVWVARSHHNDHMLQLLWRGIARYLDWNDKRYVFGSCSVPTLDPSEISSVSLKLAHEGHIHPRIAAKVLPGLRMQPGRTIAARDAGALPALFGSYLRLGAKVCGGPALAHEFGVTDYFVLLDLRDVEPRVLAGLSAPGLWKSAA